MDRSQLVYRVLRSAIERGMLVPGQHLVAQQIGDLLKISQTPVLHAFARLEGVGLVESRAYHGFYVKSLKTDELNDLFLYIEALIQRALLLIHRSSNANDILANISSIDLFSRQATSNDVTENIDVASALEQFYIEIAQYSNNPYIEISVQNFITQSHIFRIDSLDRFEFKHKVLSLLEKVPTLISDDSFDGLSGLIDDLFRLKTENIGMIWRSSAHRVPLETLELPKMPTVLKD